MPQGAKNNPARNTPALPPPSLIRAFHHAPPTPSHTSIHNFETHCCSPQEREGGGGGVGEWDGRDDARQPGISGVLCNTPTRSAEGRTEGEGGGLLVLISCP